VGVVHAGDSGGATGAGPDGNDVHGVEQTGFEGQLAAARRGDAEAWSELYQDVAPLVVGYLRAQRLSDPEDVAGEVLLELVRGFERFEGDARGFRSWVLTIAHHRLLDARRREHRRPRLVAADAHDETAANDDVEAESLSTVALAELGPALGSLTDDQRTVLLLRVVGDRSIAEVADLLGKGPSAVKQLQRRAAGALRRALETGGALSTAAEAGVPGPTGLATGRPAARAVPQSSSAA
jgi:RNA polymerase sigma factor (sigma-70 family)